MNEINTGQIGVSLVCTLGGAMVHHALHIMYPIIIVSTENFSILLHNIFLILEVLNGPGYDKKKNTKESGRAQHEPNPLKVNLAQLKHD